MKHLTTLISALFFLVIGVSHAWALPACPSSGYFHNCYGTYTYGANSKWAGDKYVGDWQNDKLHGQGTYTFANGDKYVGEHKDNKAHGQGTYTHANGNKHVGEYKDDKRNGQGTYTHANGNKYVGEYKDGKKHGQGTYNFANGIKTVGAWENNKLNGYAITYYANRSIKQEGIFKDDKFQYAEKRSKPVITPSKDSDLDTLKDICEEIGYTPKTEKFADCVLKLMDKD